MFSKDYQEKVYAGLLGKAIGVRLGAPIESIDWTYENIKKAFGNISGYVKNSRRFAADDDTNGPIFFIRSLIDSGKLNDLTPQDVAMAWLNYAREEVGMFWWGGKGISTEHTAYLNLKEGIQAPKSGSIELNGSELAEQVGGQIFIDTWGLVFPGNIAKAAQYAELAASVAHDRNGLFGARFIAACIAEAFVQSDIKGIIKKALNTIPMESDYYQKMQLVIDFYQENTTDFHKCRQFIHDNFGYQHYPGACHIIPNAAICMLGLLYGEGDFSRSIEITVMCGWDTDSNAGVVGTILGVLNGIDGIPNKYNHDINDILIASSFSGYLNIIDIPTISKEIALLGYQVNQKNIPQELLTAYHPGEIYFDFYFSRSTHGFETDNEFRLLIQEVKGHALNVLVDNLIVSDVAKLYIKPFYRQNDFGDERYQPVFTPTVYSGQKVIAEVSLELWEQDQLSITPYIHLSYTNQDVMLDSINLNQNRIEKIEFIVPNSKGDLIDELGFIVSTNSEMKDGNGTLGLFQIHKFVVTGNMEYEIDFSKQQYEFNGVTPLSYHQVKSKIYSKQLELVFNENLGKAFLGNYYSKDLIFETELELDNIEEFYLIFRVQGVENGYRIGFSKGIQLFHNDTLLKEVDYEITDLIHQLKLEVKGDSVSLYVNQQEIFCYKGIENKFGLYGYAGRNGKVYIDKCKVIASLYQKKLAIEQ